jgi:hypothetical protein
LQMEEGAFRRRRKGHAGRQFVAVDPMWHEGRAILHLIHPDELGLGAGGRRRRLRECDNRCDTD